MTTDNRQRLIIRVSRACLAFSTIDADEVVYQRYPLKSSISLAANMREALRTMPMLQKNYYRVVAMVDSPVMMTPTDLYQKSEEEELYRYTFTGHEQHAVMHAVVPDLNAVAVFSIHKDLRTVLCDRFGESVIILPIAMSVWRHAYQKSFTGPRQKLYGYVHDHYMEVFAFGQNRFKFYNSYPVGNEMNDLLYFLLSVWKLLGMNPREDELHLNGELPDKDQLTEEIRKYVKRVFIGNPSGEFNRAQVTQIEGIPYDLVTYYIKK